MKRYKNELHKQYGDFTVVAILQNRANTSGLVRWLCKCSHCGAYYITRGARLRNGRYRKHCKHCKYEQKGGSDRG